MLADKHAFEFGMVDSGGNTAYSSFLVGLVGMVDGYRRRSVGFMAHCLDEAYRLGR